MLKSGDEMEKNLNKKDKRVIKTRKAIIHATIQLMSMKSIEQITIKEIADTALINRKTFYTHYNSIYDVLNDIENDIIQSLIEILDSTDFSAERLNPYPLFEKLTTMINQDALFFHSLLQSSGHSHLLNKVKEVVKDHLLIQFDKYFPNDNVLPQYVLEFIASGLISVYQQWFSSDDHSSSLEEISKLTGLLIFDGLNGVFRQKQEELQGISKQCSQIL